MCGICGYVGDGRAIASTAMLEQLAHRGPDDIGQWTGRNGAVWLGHRRLSIIDVTAAGHQPMVAREGTLALSFNGEIYNYAEIKSELVRAGHQFTGSGDTEVLLAAWQHWGPAAVDRLRGMFAFAVWDANAQALWLVRDRMGEKPLYFATIDGGSTLIFASELRAVLASNRIPRVLDRRGLESYLAFGSVTQPNTLVHGVRMLEPGQILRYQAGQIDIRSYWTVPTEGADVDRDEALRAVRAGLDEAIELCMVSDVPVGLLLSGGVDSTAILARLRAMGHEDLSTFSVGFAGPGADVSEADWARQTASHFGTNHQEVLIAPSTAAELIPLALTAVDLPSVDGFNHYLVFQAIAQAGFKVAITGQGADELFFGYARHAAHAATQRIARLTAPASVRAIASSIGSAIAPRSRWAAKGMSLLGSGEPDRLAYVARHTVFTSDEIIALKGEEADESPAGYVPHVTGDSSLAKLYRMELVHFLRNQLLRDGDQMSMSRSLELRAPFVDYRLVELVSSLPTSVKHTPKRQKALLVDAVNDDYVRRAAERPKSGFPFPLRRWVTETMDPRSFSPDMFGLNPRLVREVIQRGLQGRGFSQYWALLVLAQWMQANRIEAA